MFTCHNWLFPQLIDLLLMFISPKIGISKKLRLFQIDINEIFPIQSSEFAKSLWFEKKTATKIKIKLFFSPKNRFLKISEFKIFHSVESYDKQTAENWRNFNEAEERIGSKL